VEVPGKGPAEVVRTDPANDLALLRVPGTSEGASLRISPPRLGEDVVALGYPLAVLMADSLTVTAGNVNSLSGLRGDIRALQIDTPVQPGNSGGPLFDRFGAVVGVVSSQLDEAKMQELTGTVPQNVNFAIKASMLNDFLHAAGISPLLAGQSGAEKSIADVAELAKPLTVQIVCQG
jgi:S1-C subfamily serine protease